MANISLYYVEGINKEDTPYFSSKEAQESYFSTCVVAPVDDDGFYPPYYRNEIKLSTDNLSLNTKANYLSLFYEGKYYYYFINNCTYISQDVISISIEMDVIQTYMFDISVQNGIIERKFINRWNADLINRNYIRENFSNGLFDLYKRFVFNKSNDFTTYMLNKAGIELQQGGTPDDPTYPDNIKIFESDETEYWIIFKCSDRINVDKTDITLSEYSQGHQSNIKSTYTYNEIFDNAQECKTLYYYYGLPFNSKVVKSGKINLNGLDFDFTASMMSVAKESVVVAAYLLPCSCFPDIILNGINCYGPLNSDLANMKKAIVLDWKDGVFGSVRCGVIKFPYTIQFASLLDVHSLYFSKNKEKSKKFESKYCPVMIDENYIRLSFGEPDNSTTFQLHLSTDPTFILEYLNDIDGARYYNIYPNNIYSEEKGINNYYQCLLCSPNISQYDLMSDKWLEYLNYNKATIPLTLLSFGVTALTGFSNYAVAAGAINTGINAILSNPKSYDRRYKEPRPLRKKPKAQYNKLYDEGVENDREYALEAAGDVSSTLNSLSSAANAYLAPIGSRVCGTAGTDIASKSIYPQSVEYRVADFDYVSWVYHLNGYLVNEVVNNIDNIFEYVNTRYYYNVLKMGVCNIHLDCLELDNAIVNITARLNAGIRLWNVENSDVVMGDTQYDNVEKSLLEVQNA